MDCLGYHAASGAEAALSSSGALERTALDGDLNGEVTLTLVSPVTKGRPVAASPSSVGLRTQRERRPLGNPLRIGGTCARIGWTGVAWHGTTTWGTTGLRPRVGTLGGRSRMTHPIDGWELSLAGKLCPPAAQEETLKLIRLAASDTLRANTAVQREMRDSVRRRGQHSSYSAL